MSRTFSIKATSIMMVTCYTCCKCFSSVFQIFMLLNPLVLSCFSYHCILLNMLFLIQRLDIYLFHCFSVFEQIYSLFEGINTLYSFLFSFSFFLGIFLVMAWRLILFSKTPIQLLKTVLRTTHNNLLNIL